MRVTLYGIVLPLMSEALSLKRCFILKKVNIANVAREHLVFVPTSTSFVDLTLYGDRVDIQSWSFLSIPSLSDHPYMYFEVNSVKPVPPKAKRTNPPLPKLCSINQVFFNELLLKESKQ